MEGTRTRWYVGAMNDALFVIDQPPRPSNDYINPDAKANVIAKVAEGPGSDERARLLAAAPALLEVANGVRLLGLNFANIELDPLRWRATFLALLEDANAAVATTKV